MRHILQPFRTDYERLVAAGITNPALMRDYQAPGTIIEQAGPAEPLLRPQAMTAGVDWHITMPWDSPVPAPIVGPMPITPQQFLEDPTLRPPIQQAGFGALVPLAVWFVRLSPRIIGLASRAGMAVGATTAFIRANALRIAATAGLVAAGAFISDILNLDQDEGMRVALEIAAEKKKKRRRYTIGSNPRVRTLQKVARHTMKLLKRHEKYIREFFPKKSRSGELAARERAHHRLIGKVAD